MTWDAPAVVLVIGAAGTLIVSAINAWKTNSLNTKSDKLIIKADEIHELANSRLTNVTDLLTAANQRIEVLEKSLNTIIDHKDMNLQGKK